MAGDWIKIEIGTPDKPEVFQMARILGLDRDAVFGKLVRFWSWIDRQSVDGHVDGVVDADVDRLVHQIGFTDAMVRVGWLIVDRRAETIALPNFEAHNGETAKKRALKNKRQAKWREGKVENVDVTVDAPTSTSASTREEKRRDNKHNKLIKAFRPPSVQEITDYCAERGNQVNPDQFADHYTANGWKVGKNPMRDWKAAVRTWERNSTGGNGHAAHQQDTRSRTKRVSDKLDEIARRDIQANGFTAKLG